MSFRIALDGRAYCLNCGDSCENRAAAKIRHKCKPPEWLAKARARQAQEEL